MKTCHIFLFLLNLTFFVEGALSQQTIDNDAFAVGESLVYRVYYHSGIGNVSAGEASMTVDNWSEHYTGNNITVFHFKGRGNSTGLFNFFFKVRDKFDSYVDKQTLLPYLFVRETREGKYEKDDRVTFNRENSKATSLSDITIVPDDVQDVISAIYFMRTLQVDDFNADSLYFLNFFLDDSVYTSAIKYEGKRMLKTKWGYVRCLKIAPMMATGEVFADKYPMYVWVSDDMNHVPILAEAEVIVGSVRVELVEYSGLLHPLVFSEKQ